MFRFRAFLTALVLGCALAAVPTSTNTLADGPSDFAQAAAPIADSETRGSRTRDKKSERYFERIATFPIIENFCAGNPDPDCLDEETVAEIVAAADHGRTLIYTDAANGSIGFIDITDPSAPAPAGVLEVGGDPTSVGVAGRYALVAVVGDGTFDAPQGFLSLVDIDDQAIVGTIDLGGQPDSVAISPDGKYAAVVIENERDEDRCVEGTRDGEIDIGDDECEAGGGLLGYPPQTPPGALAVIELDGQPWQWNVRFVSLTGVPDKYPSDPEPESVDINRHNIAVVTMQENNHIALVDLERALVIRDFSAGKARVTGVDVEDDGLITLDTDIDLPREADAVAWITDELFATADEGDLEGGTRGFTVYDEDGEIEFAAGNAVEYEIVRAGHYAEGRSDNKGNEPEGAEFGSYRRGGDFLFIGSERSSVVLVYDVSKPEKTKLHQTLAVGGLGPEGLLAIPRRDLFVASTENDDRGDKFRAALTVWRLGAEKPDYPTIVSKDRGGRPIPWAALSGLAGDPENRDRVYGVYDSFFRKSRIFEIGTKKQGPAEIQDETVLVALADDVRAALADAGIEIEDDNTVDLDPEGIAVREDDRFWIVSEGAGSVDDPARPIATRNLLLEVDQDGEITQAVRLPEAVDALQRRFGYEGVASIGDDDDEAVYVAIQREWVGDPAGFVRIGRYVPASGAWTFAYYQLDTPTSPNGGWVGLSELVAVGHDRLAVVERDDQANSDARIKRIYAFDLDEVEFRPEGQELARMLKGIEIRLVQDLLPALKRPNGPVLEKVEGMAVLRDRDVVIVTDNDGVDDASGETQFINLGPLF